MGDEELNNLAEKFVDEHGTEFSQAMYYGVPRDMCYVLVDFCKTILTKVALNKENPWFDAPAVREIEKVIR